MNAKRTLNDEIRLEISQMLNRLIAEENVLHAATLDYHWNATGEKSRGLHLLFQRQYEQITHWIDRLSERSCFIGTAAHAGWTHLQKATHISVAPGIGLPCEHMIAMLLSLHEEIIIKLILAIEACRKRYNDSGTADFLTDLMDHHELTAWILRSHYFDLVSQAS